MQQTSADDDDDGSPSHSEVEAVPTDSEFRWTLRRFGLLFSGLEDPGGDGEGAARLESGIFSTRNGEDPDNPHRWRLRARCRRMCPQSMLRVSIALISLNDRRVAGRLVWTLTH